MSDYKNCGDVITEIKRFKGYLDDDMIARLTIAIDRIPSADVVEVRHGHWIYTAKVRPECPDDSDCYYECSECHAGDEHNKRVQVPYCWHCGARMDGEGE